MTESAKQELFGELSDALQKALCNLASEYDNPKAVNAYRLVSLAGEIIDTAEDILK